jgi:hypothetical protein
MSRNMPADVFKYMLQWLILSGRIGKWAYALIELVDTPRVAAEIYN